MQAGAPGHARLVEVAAPAKVNLVLRVLERESSGYHRLETYFQALELADRVRVALTRDEGIALTVSGADLGPVQDNLAWRAAQAYLREAGLGRGVRIELEKRIPAGAGLGGGSSDAAATLRALDVLLGALSDERLRQVAALLGSDVSFFLCGSPLAFGRGRGEQLTPLSPLEAAPVIVAFPGVHVSSAHAYQALDRKREEPAEGGGPAAGSGAPAAPLSSELADWAAVERLAHNDFEELICEAHPEVAVARAALRGTGARFVLLSGSGSALFAVYDEEAAAREASLRLERDSTVAHALTRTATAVPEPAIEAGSGASGDGSPAAATGLKDSHGRE
jgi:4-diphosphocytidyl-2-C-methyl-D-erythritol kinase